MRTWQKIAAKRDLLEYMFRLSLPLWAQARVWNEIFGTKMDKAYLSRQYRKHKHLQKIIDHIKEDIRYIFVADVQEGIKKALEFAKSENHERVSEVEPIALKEVTLKSIKINQKPKARKRLDALTQDIPLI